MKVYTGIDVHRYRSQVAIVDEQGIEVSNRNYDNASPEFRDALDELDPGTPVAFEAAYGWGWLADLLEERELDVHMVNPSQCKAIASARLKNDKVDARTIAQLLRTDFLPEAWIAPIAVRELRVLVRHRSALVKIRTGLKNRIHGVLADEGLKAEEESLWSQQGEVWLGTVPLRPAHRQAVDHYRAILASLAGPIAELEAEINARAKSDPRVKALCAQPGVGPIVAVTLLSEIGDISRFPTARKLCAWAGLTPAVRNSDRKVRHGHITKAGPGSVRCVLTEASYQARRFPPFAASFEAIKQRRGKAVATVALSRKLLASSFHILKDLEASGADR
ncbi:MAG TPA: IS110 family transposase [Actinomycetota bacterium]|nr:IS110 family transposase [Actinomycetota bacterium]